MTVKYQVFVSSTYDDLRKEREQVIKAVLELGHIPVGMEMFSADDEEQWKLIARQIEQSDYYVVIVAQRYGSTVDGLSFTEREYEYAITKGVPVLGFVLDSAAPWPSDRVEDDAVARESLARFKERVRRKPVGFWTSADDLHGKFSIALVKQISSNPRTGWIPATSVVGPEVMIELSRLSRENAVLRAEIETRNSADAVRTGYDKMLRLLEKNTLEAKVLYQGAAGWSDTVRITLYKLFAILGPELAIEKSVEDAARYVGLMVNPDKNRRANTIAVNVMKSWLTDLMALGLVCPSDRKHQVSDKGEYWTLTEDGRRTLEYMHRARLERETEPVAVQVDKCDETAVRPERS